VLALKIWLHNALNRKEKIMRKVLFLATMLAFVMTSSVWAADLSGIWTIKFIKVDGAEDSFDVAIKDASGNLTITGNHSQLGPLSGNGTAKGDAVNMDIKATGSLPVEFIFSGNVAGNKISGTRDIKMTGGQSGGQGSQGGQAPAGGSQSGQAPAGGSQSGQGSATGQSSNAFTAEKK
jgi:hypothetical protein